VALQLYLPKEWAEDLPRRQKAGVPDAVEFATKPTLALAQIERLMAQGAPRYCVLTDAGYGVETAFRERLSELGLPYVVGVTGQVTVWPPGHAPLPPEPYSGRGNVPTRLRLGEAKQQRPMSVKELAFEVDPSQWLSVEWREGTNFTLRSRFARVRVRAAHRDQQRTELRPQEWLLIEWPEGHKEPMKYWLSTLSEDTSLQRMVLEAKMRWRIERDYQDLKQELGLGHYEGRGWRGFHHHASLSIAAYGFLMVQQLRHPQGVGKKNAARREEPALPTHYKPRGSPAHAAPRPIVHHDFAAAYRRSVAQDIAPLPVLPARKHKATLVTQ
jgi:SRSO17 transposase